VCFDKKTAMKTWRVSASSCGWRALILLNHYIYLITTFKMLSWTGHWEAQSYPVKAGFVINGKSVKLGTIPILQADT
jgi:hypothetical protein